MRVSLETDSFVHMSGLLYLQASIERVADLCKDTLRVELGYGDNSVYISVHYYRSDGTYTIICIYVP